MATLLRTGLVSLALRKQKPEHIVRFANDAELAVIEWSGLAHNPLSKEAISQELATLTADAGLEIVAFASQHRVGDTTRMAVPLDREIAAAVALGAPMMRVFVGTKPSADLADSDWRRLDEKFQETVEVVNAAGLRLAIEHQGNTCNDTSDSCLRLLNTVKGKNVCTYWQPDYQIEENDRYNALKALYKKLGNVHVFHWADGERVALERGYRQWMYYVNLLRDEDVQTSLLIELVEGDHPENLIRDAKTLQDLVRGRELEEVID